MATDGGVHTAVATENKKDFKKICICCCRRGLNEHLILMQLKILKSIQQVGLFFTKWYCPKSHYNCTQTSRKDTFKKRRSYINSFNQKSCGILQLYYSRSTQKCSRPFSNLGHATIPVRNECFFAGCLKSPLHTFSLKANNHQIQP